MDKTKPIVIAKFGGSSLSSVERMLSCARLVLERPHVRLAIVSATGGATDRLLCIADHAAKGEWSQSEELLGELYSIHFAMGESLASCSNGTLELEEIRKICEEANRLAHGIYLLRDASPKVLDQLLSVGERLSSLLFKKALERVGVSCDLCDMREILCTTEEYGKAEPLVDMLSFRASKLLKPHLLEGKLIVSQGFIGATLDGHTTTLGRGGSDYTASLLGEALGASHIEIWTDVSGISSADPRIVSDAQTIEEISFSEAAELATFGAKVLHPATLWPAIRNDIPVYIGNSLDPGAKGTWVRKEVKEYPDIRAIALRRRQTLLTVHSLSMFGRPGFLSKVFAALAKHNISVDLVTTSEVSVSLTIDGTQDWPQNVVEELQKFSEVKIERNLALLALVGNRATSTPGIARSIFKAVEENVRLICHGASSHNFCFLVDDSVSVGAICRLHEEFIGKEKTAEEMNLCRN